jgi:hypothetical protein
MPRASRHCPTSSGQDFKLQDDALDDESSSTASFATCPEAELVNIIQLKDNGVDDGAPAEVQGISGTLTITKETQLGDKQIPDNGSPSSMSEVKCLGRGRDKRASWVQWWYETVLRRKPGILSESNTSKKEHHRPGASMTPTSPRLQLATSQGDLAPGIRPHASGKIRNTSVKIKSLKTTNELGYKNLAELYARYDKVRGTRQETEPESFDTPASSHGLAVTASMHACEDMKKMQCRFCSVYFTPEQNLRVLDSGLSPCSFHPGKKHSDTPKFRRLITVTM